MVPLSLRERTQSSEGIQVIAPGTMPMDPGAPQPLSNHA